MTSLRDQAPVVFSYPSRMVGGTEWLLIRTARALAESEGRRVAVVDFADGFLASQLKGSSVELLVYEEGRRTPVPRGSIVVTPIAFLYRAWRELELSPEERIVLWALHPLASRSLLPPVPGPLARRLLQLGGEEALDWGRKLSAPHDLWLVRRTLRLLDEAGALLFMDEDNRQGAERAMRLHFPRPLFVPVCVPESKRRAQPRPEGSPLRAGWLGRLSESKVRMLAHVAQDLAQHAQSTGERIELTVVGDGEARAQLERALPPKELLPVRFAGTLLGDRLEEWLETGVDLLFACGTSALEAAKTGVPAVLVDEASDEALLAGYRYRWLHEATGYSLGVAITPGNVPSHPHPLSALLAAVATPEGWRAQAAQALAYFEQHHSLERTAARIGQVLDASSASMERLARAGLAREGLTRRTGRALQRLLAGSFLSRTTTA